MQNFSMYEIIDQKKRGKQLSDDEIKWVIDSLLNKTIGHYQMSALLMAMFLQGMSIKETAALTDAMLHSGEVLSFEGHRVVDKHSTGGVGDKASFILAPIAAACGVMVPMIAGRGLGHTGGTIDKVEAIKGFKTNLSLKKFQQLLNKNGQVLIGQTQQIAPADRIIYGLRDVTATVDSVPLITASIMSKKLAEGANGIVMDIKVGSGAFMGTKSDARKLAKSILGTAKRFEKSSVAILTDMNQPLGNYVGNSLEILESVEVLKNKGPKDLTEVSLVLSAWMIKLAGIEKTYAKALSKAKRALKDGSALKKFEELIKAQGGDTTFINNYSRLPMASEILAVTASKDGFIKSFQCNEIGLALTELGGGRKVAGQKIDHRVGFKFNKKVGDKIKAGETIVEIHHNKNQVSIAHQVAEDFISSIIKISTGPVKVTGPIIETIEGESYV